MPRPIPFAKPLFATFAIDSSAVEEALRHGEEIEANRQNRVISFFPASCALFTKTPGCIYRLLLSLSATQALHCPLASGSLPSYIGHANF
jgi:hypothetical protein